MKKLWITLLFSTTLAWAAPPNPPKTAAEFQQAALEHMNKGQMGEAVHDFGFAIELNPFDPLNFFGRARARDDHAGKLKDFEKALHLDPFFVQVYAERGRYFHENRQFDEALLDFQKLVRLTPARAESYMLRAASLMSLVRYPEAIDDLNSAIKLGLEDDNIYMTRGRLHEKLNQKSKALDDYATALKFNDNRTDLFLAIGLVQKDLGQIEMAEQAFSIVLDSDKHNSVARLQRSFIYLQQKRWLAAQRDAQHLLKRDKDLIEAYIALALASQGQGASKKALNLLNKALKRQVDHPWALLVRSRIFAEQSLLGKAEADVRRFLELWPEGREGEALHIEALEHACELAFEQQSYGWAISSLEGLLAHLGPKPDILLKLGMAHLELKRPMMAIPLLKRAQGFDEQNPMIDLQLGLAYKQQSEYEEAIRMYSHAIEKDEQFAEAYYNRANAAYELGWFDQAVKDYDQTLALRPFWTDAQHNRQLALESLRGV